MAVMWPKILPPDVADNMLRSTECEVYRRLECVLDNSFVIFYSRPWLGLKPDGEEIDGECDFIVAHAELGMLMLEVKGGAVAYDPGKDQWTSRDRWGVTHNIKNPVNQARRAKHELLKKLNAAPHWNSRRIRARHGVVLPHSSTPVGDLGADMPLRIFCFSEQFEASLRDWVLERFGDVISDDGRIKALGRDGVHALEKILARPFQLRSPLRTVLSQDDSKLQILTQQQFQILRAIEEVPRAAISGAAGTGKTVLAMEEAKRCAGAGLRTLLACFNRGLATEIRRRLGSCDLVSAMTFHELCAEVTRRANIPKPEGFPTRKLFEEIWPELLMQAFELLPDERYDAIIIDEGQDFMPLWWTAIESGLNGNGGGKFRVFYDNNQRVYGSTFELPKEVDLVPIRLTLNLRNTKRIHELICQHYTGHEVKAVGPGGIDVLCINVESPEALAKRISDCVTRLNSVERIVSDDIAILVGSEADIAKIAPRMRVGGFNAARCDEQSEGRIVIDSIRRFKGLERSVIVVSVTPDIILDKELPYVALSRARTYLVLVGEDRHLNHIRGVQQ